MNESTHTQADEGSGQVNTICSLHRTMNSSTHTQADEGNAQVNIIIKIPMTCFFTSFAHIPNTKYKTNVCAHFCATAARKGFILSERETVTSQYLATYSCSQRYSIFYDCSK